MMKNRIMIFVIVLLAAFAIGWLAYTHFLDSPKDEAGEHLVQEVERIPGRGFNRMAAYLELDSKQWQQFRDLEHQYRDSLCELMDQSNELEANILTELSKLQPDKMILNRYVNEIGKLKASSRQLTIDHFLTLKAICNPEQAEKLNALFLDMEHGQGSRGRGQGYGQGRGH